MAAHALPQAGPILLPPGTGVYLEGSVNHPPLGARPFLSASPTLPPPPPLGGVPAFFKMVGALF